ncbi:sensor histidine kinase [Gorillibacterium sp. sgz500922]|uniref:sensor histidine kinase n=1 Tax=Gorillibacterium sp. sgz500922 TaxID=3446694 RepID=UPI003F680C7D
MTFTRKTVLLLTAVTAAVLLASNLFVYVTYSRWTQTNQMKVLSAELNEMEQRIQDIRFLPNLLRFGSLEQPIKPDLSSLEAALGSGQALRLATESGRLLAETGDGAERLGRLPDSAGGAGRIRLDGVEIAYVQKTITLLSAGKVRLQLLQPAGRDDASLAQIGKLLRVATVLGILAAAAGALFAARRTIAPVKRMTDRVRRIDGGRLSGADRLELPPARDEIRELAVTFNRLLDRIDEAMERERRFVADASHELKTPLAAIEGHAQLLRRWGKEKPEVLDESLGYIVGETERMKKLSRQLLLLAELEERARSEGGRGEADSRPLGGSDAGAAGAGVEAAAAGTGSAAVDMKAASDEGSPAAEWTAGAGSSRSEVAGVAGAAGAAGSAGAIEAAEAAGTTGATGATGTFGAAGTAEATGAAGAVRAAANPGGASPATDAAALVRGLVREGALLYPALRVACVGADEPLPVRVPAFELEQAVRNVLVNALEYTPEGGSVQVSACREAGHAILAVTDTGPGIPADELPHLFERFYRSDPSRSRERGGTGLGLAIVKRIADTYGGSVRLKSGPGRGTTAVLVFPQAD